jgi:hypothetical protein
MGLKFVPHNNFNISDLYYKIIKDIDQELLTLNKKLYLFNKPNNNNSKITFNNNSTIVNMNVINQDTETQTDSLENSNINSIINNFKKLKRKDNFDQLKFELSEDIVNLRFQIIKELPNNYKNFKSNIT